MAFLWGNRHRGQSSGSLVKLPAGIAASIRSNGAPLRAVVIQGHPSLIANTGNTALSPGSYFGARDTKMPRVSCSAKQDCILYVRAHGTFDIVPSDHTPQQ